MEYLSADIDGDPLSITMAQRCAMAVVGALVVASVCIGWFFSWGLGFGPYVFVLLLVVLGVVPFLVGRGLANRRGHSRLWLGVLGFVVGLVAGFFAAELLDQMIHAPEREFENERMRLDLFVGALAGATLFSSLGVLLGSQPPGSENQASR